MTMRDGKTEYGLYFILFAVGAQCVLFPVIAATLLAMMFPFAADSIHLLGPFISVVEAMAFLAFVVVGEGC